MIDPILPNRLKAGSAGLGEADSSEIERRAVELAMIDGRDAFTDADLAQAAAELAGGTVEPLAPEVAASTIEETDAWDAPVDESGHRSPKLSYEDETSVPEQLIRDGIEEADHDRRVAAAEESDDAV